MNTIYSPESIEVVFRTPDGVTHDSISEALSHLSLVPAVPTSDYELYIQDPNNGLVKTDNLESCHFAFFPDDGAKKKFFVDMEEADYSTDGMTGDKEGPVWYEWNAHLWEWAHVGESVVNLLNFLRES